MMIGVFFRMNDDASALEPSTTFFPESESANSPLFEVMRYAPFPSGTSFHSWESAPSAVCWQTFAPAAALPPSMARSLPEHSDSIVQ